MAIPTKNIGFLPYISPSLVRVTEPNTIPARNSDPNNPILNYESQYKSKYIMKLLSDSAFDQSIFHLRVVSSQNSTALQDSQKPPLKHKYRGSNSRNTSEDKKNDEELIVTTVINALIH